MKKNRILLLLILTMFSFLVSAQDDNPVIKEYKEGWDAEKGYIITNNDEYKQGYLLISKDMNNSQYVDFLKYIKAQPERFTIEDIKEYGYNDIVYVSMHYKGEIVFMQKMNSKKPFLYYYKSEEVREFYIIKDGELLLLPQEKDELRKFLEDELSTCKLSVKNAKIAIYNKIRLKYIFERHSECDKNRIPFFNYGVNLGYGLSNLDLAPERVISFYDPSGTNPGLVSQKVGSFDGKLASSIYGGLFVDIPLSSYGGKISAHPEIQFRMAKYSFEKDAYNEFNFDINYIYANILARYKTLNPQKAFFIDFGFNYSIINVRDSYYSDKYNNENFKLNPILEDNVYGIVAGFGVSYPFSVRNFVDIAVRCSYLKSQGKMPNVANFDLLVGLSF